MIAGSPDVRPVVVHVTRHPLRPTETFIDNQIRYASRYRPVIVCHHRTGETFATAGGMAACDALPPWVRRLEAFTDRLLRLPLPASLDRMADYVRDEGARVLHFHYLPNARSYLGLKRRTGLPAVVSAYGYDVSTFPARLAGAGRRFLAPMLHEIDCCLAMSDTMRADLVSLGVPAERIRVLYHGIDTRRFATAGREQARGAELTVLCCGRLAAGKGQLRLVEAIALLRRDRVPVRLVLVGDGPCRARLEQAVDAHGLRGHVEMTGHIPHRSSDLVRHYSRADVFALSSTSAGGEREGIPGALVEAMAAGLPCVATRHGSIPAVVSNGDTGLLVEEDDAAGLAAALARLAGDPELRQRLGVAAARRARVDLDVHTATTGRERVYDDLTGAAR